MEKLFLIHKELTHETSIGPDKVYSRLRLYYTIHLEVIKRVKGFLLNEKFTISTLHSINDLIKKHPGIWIKGETYPIESFITMEDYRDMKLRDILS